MGDTRMFEGMKRKYLRNLISLPPNTALLYFVCSLWCPGSPFMHRKTWQNTWLPLHWILSPCVFNISLWSDSSRADLNISLYGDQYVFIHTVIILFILMLEHWISCWKSEDSHTFFSHLDISDYADIQILNKLLMSFPTSFFFFSPQKQISQPLRETEWKSLNEKTHAHDCSLRNRSPFLSQCELPELCWLLGERGKGRRSKGMEIL